MSQARLTHTGNSHAQFFRIVSMATAVGLLIAACAVGTSLAMPASEGCISAPPAPAFNNSAYGGLWYEIGKIQTAGGGFFEKDCVCTIIDVAYTNSETGDGKVLNSCRKKTVDGSYLNATGTLSSENPQGKWYEGFFPLAPKVSYTIIFIGDDYAVEYDCGSTLGFVNYCIHILSRKPTMDQALFDRLIADSVALGLNTQNLPVQVTKQDGCW